MLFKFWERIPYSKQGKSVQTHKLTNAEQFYGLHVRQPESFGFLSRWLPKSTGLYTRHLGKIRRRWEANIIMNWVGSAQERDYSKALVNAALNLRVP